MIHKELLMKRCKKELLVIKADIRQYRQVVISKTSRTTLTNMGPTKGLFAWVQEKIS